MKIRIALIGSPTMMNRVLQHETSFPEATLMPHVYRKPEEAAELVRSVRDCDVLFFTGPLPYHFAKAAAGELELPAVHVSFDEYMIALTLYDIRQRLQTPGGALSIDIPKAEYVRSVARELGLSYEQFHVKPYFPTDDPREASVNTDDMVNFHLRLWQSGESVLALTGIDAVFVRLQQLGVPCHRMHIPEKNIGDALAKAVAQGQLLVSSNSQIAVGFASIDRYETLTNERGSYAGQELSLKVHQLLLQLGKQMDASIQQTSASRFVLYGTRGAVQTGTGMMRELPVLSEVRQLTGVTISVGFGYGATAREAEHNAGIALHHARQAGGDKGYIVTDGKTVIGPLDDDIRSYQLRSEDSQIVSVAERAGLSVATVSKLYEFLRLRHFAGFSVQELAEYQQVQRRTVERVVKKLLDSGVIRVAGEEQPFRKGKPRSVYQFNL